MTNEEKARSLLRSFEAAVHPSMRDTLVTCVTDLLDKAKLEGWEEAEKVLRGGIHPSRTLERNNSLRYAAGILATRKPKNGA